MAFVAVAIGPTRTRAFRRPQGPVDWANRAAVGELGVTVRATWREGGPITLDAQEGIASPEMPWVPGAYRMTLSGAPEQARPRVYTGETDLLQRRMAHYRNPGPTQSTNIRMNAALRKHLASGGLASIASSRTRSCTRPLMRGPSSRSTSRVKLRAGSSKTQR